MPSGFFRSHPVTAELRNEFGGEEERELEAGRLGSFK